MNTHLTIPNPSLDELIRATHCGMAHWAGTGPQGETCRTCAHWTGCDRATGHYANGRGLKPRSCAKYRSMMNGSIGALVPHDALACRHFVAAERPPSISGK